MAIDAHMAKATAREAGVMVTRVGWGEWKSTVMSLPVGFHSLDEALFFRPQWGRAGGWGNRRVNDIRSDLPEVSLNICDEFRHPELLKCKEDLSLQVVLYASYHGGPQINLGDRGTESVEGVKPLYLEEYLIKSIEW